MLQMKQQHGTKRMSDTCFTVSGRVCAFKHESCSECEVTWGLLHSWWSWPDKVRPLSGRRTPTTQWSDCEPSQESSSPPSHPTGGSRERQFWTTTVQRQFLKEKNVKLRGFISPIGPFEIEVKLHFKDWPQTSQGQDVTVPRSSIQRGFSLKLSVITLSLSQLFNTAG